MEGMREKSEGGVWETERNLEQTIKRIERLNMFLTGAVVVELVILILLL